MQSDRKRVLLDLPNEESSYVVACVSGITRRSDHSRNVKMSSTALTFMRLCIVNVFSSTTNKMQCYTIFFTVVSALHVSSGFSTHHQELKNYTCSIRYLSNLFVATASRGEPAAHHQELKNCTCSIVYLSNLFAVTASMGESGLTHASGHSIQV